MSLQTTLTFTCDYSKCEEGNPGPAVVSWCQEAAAKDESVMPEVAKYLVMFNQNGVLKTFCCQLHAAEFFLPPGYEAVQKKVIDFPKPVEEPTNVLPWTRKPDDGRNVISRSEADSAPQADGDNSPYDGPGGLPLDTF